MDLVDFIRHNFSDLYKQRPDPSVPTAVKNRVVKMNEKRRVTRLETVCEKRKIPVDMSPFVTPGLKRIRKEKKEVTVMEKPVDQGTKERLEMLAKWKAEKAKKKQQDKKNAKPMFKVTHVPVSVGLPNLENINMEIKGKRFKSKFAPPNHKFKPPANIKPIHFENNTKKNSTVKEKSLVTQTKANRSTVKEKSTFTETKSNRMLTRSQAQGRLVTPAVASVQSLKKSEPKSKNKVQKKKQEDLNASMSPDFPLTNSEIAEDKGFKTPQKNAPPAYVSPFVTLSRGKNSARKEYEARRSGKSFTAKVDTLDCTSPRAGAAYFRWILNNHISQLEQQCDLWNKYKDTVSPPEEAISMIDVAIGQAKLFISKKCVQFQGLIEKCTENDSETPVTCEDLHGFWDMMLIQVNNLDKRFENLTNLKTNNWEEVVPEVKKRDVKRKGRPQKNTKASSSLKEAIQAARRKKQNKTEESPIVERKTPQNKKSCRTSQVISVEKSKRFSSPGLMMMKVAQYAKNVETPTKSILKAETARSVKSHSKSVIFREQIVNNENDMNKSNSKVKTPSRRSTRLSRSKLF